MPTVTYRPQSSWFWTGGCWAGLALVGVALIQGYGVRELRVIPLLLALALLAWRLFWLPEVTSDDEGVTLLNPFRRIQVPWTAVIDLRMTYSLTLVTPTGRYSAWAAPASRRERATHGRVHRSGGPADLVHRHWRSLVEAESIQLGVADETQVSVQWDRAGLLSVLVLGAVGIVVALL